MPTKKYNARRAVRGGKSKYSRRRGALSNQIARKDMLSAQGPRIYNPAPYLKRGPVNDAFFTKHRYVDTITLSTETVTGLMGPTHLFRLNSLYDPDLTGTGHQPSGFAEMTAMYNKYCVYGVSCSLSIGNSSDANTLLGYWVQSSSNTLQMVGMNATQIGESPGQSAIFTETQNQTSAWRTVDLGYMSIASIQGRTTQQIFAEDNFAANYTSNPVTVPLLQLSAGSVTLQANKSISVRVEFVFHTKWNQRKAITAQ